MTPDPRSLTLDAIAESVALVPALQREVAELRAEVEAMRGRSLVCPSCGSTNFRITKTYQQEDHRVRRIRRCRGCGEKVNTVEVIG